MKKFAFQKGGLLERGVNRDGGLSKAFVICARINNAESVM